jgi:phosphoribosylanthranilate isomerase
MHRTRVKICGITRAQDALAAAQAGADAIGMVFYRSAKRCITLDTARHVLAELPPFVTPVGLFVNSPPSEIQQVASALGLRHLQLHGDEDIECVRRLEGYALIKAVRVAKQTFEAELDYWRELNLLQLRGLVLETHADGPGGTGVSNDWETVRRARDAGAFDGLPAIIAAGGLTPQNVGQIVRDIRPWAVDVSSGVESTYGIKSAEKIAAFISAVRAAEP